MKKNKLKIPPLILYAAIAAAVIAADQITKYAATAALSGIDTFPLIKNVIHFTYVKNPGAAFGMLSDNRWVFMILSSVAIVAIAAFIAINRNGRIMTNVAVAMIFGGGVGNMIDRFAKGFVVDFIDFRLINFWVFNVADSFVCIGAGLLILSLILGEIKSRVKIEPINKRRISVCILLSVITFGLYSVFWAYLLVKNTKTVKHDDTSCKGELLCLIFVPFYSLYWWFTRGKKVKDSFADRGYSVFGNETAYLILGIFGLRIVSMAIMQNDFNSLPPDHDFSIQQRTEAGKEHGGEAGE